MSIEEIKKEYNKLLKRFYDGNEYFENENISNEEKEKHLQTYIEILNGLNYYLSKLEVYTKQEVLEGF